MHILHVDARTFTEPSGSVIAAQTLFAELRRQGHRVTTVILDDPRPPLIGPAIRVGVANHGKVFSWRRARVGRALTSAVRAILKRTRVDLIMTKGHAEVALPILDMAQKHEVPVVHDWHIVEAEDYALAGWFRRGSLRYREYVRAEQEVLQRAAGVVTVSPELLRQARALNGRVLLLSSAVDLSTLRNPFPSLWSRRWTAARRHGLVVGYCGTLYPWQGVRTLVRALLFLPGNTTLCVVTRGAHLGILQRALREVPNVRERVEWLLDAPHEKVGSLLSSWHVVVAPFSALPRNLRCGFSSVKLLDYLAVGTAIIASDLPAVRRMVGTAALLVAPDDPRALAHGILQAAQAPLRQRLMRRARRRAQRFHVTPIVTRRIQFYDQLIRETRRL